ncbi:hypothetical protein TNCV_778941 [Trichonephila clavipes]|nr:hypothetical protein TNCV_778941 [Trichonephila clavipes]
MPIRRPSRATQLSKAGSLRMSEPLALETALRTRNSRPEKKERRKCITRKKVENREESLGYPEVVTPVFTKDSNPLEKRKRSLGHLGIVTPVLT